MQIVPKLRNAALGAAIFVALSGISPAIAFTTLDYPDSVSTQADDISGGRIVGSYQDSTFLQHGFLYDGGNYAAIDYPGGFSTRATGVDGGLIVGTYQGGPGDFAYHGFVHDGTNYTPLNYPSAGHTFAEGIDGTNVVGSYLNGAGPGSERRGFLYDGTTYSTINYPGSMVTEAHGIDGNRIVGLYLPGGGPGGGVHGFVFDGANYTPLDYPGSTSTEAYGISGNNIVGRYTDSSFASHGFVYDGTDWITVDAPFAGDTRLHGVEGDNIVGSYFGGPVQHGFQSTKPVPPQEHVFRFTGEVTSVEDGMGWFNESFHVGDPVEGDYNLFDSGFQLGAGGPVPIAIYTYYSGPNPVGLPPLPGHLRIGTGGREYETGPTTVVSEYALQLTNDSDGSVGPPPGDTYLVSSPLSFPENFMNFVCDPSVDPACSLLPYTKMSLRLYDANGNALPSLDLPLTAPDLSKYGSAIGRIWISDANTSDNYAMVEFRIDSIVAVPEPTGASLLLAGAVLCLRWNRWHRVGDFAT